MNNLTDDWNRLTLLHSLARHIDHQITCILAIPNFPDNDGIIDGYKTRLAKTLEETRELLNKAAEETK